MTVGERIRNRRIELGMSVDDIAEKLGKNRATVYRYENGYIEEMPAKTLAKIADILHTTPADLLGTGEEESSNPFSIPILGRVAAGFPIQEFATDLGSIELSEDMYKKGEYFALEIHGDSMSPNILDGDIVIVRQQPDAESGETVIATIDGEDATCKRLRKFRNGIELIANNPAYPPFEFTNKEIKELPVTILGKVVELRRTI